MVNSKEAWVHKMRVDRTEFLENFQRKLLWNVLEGSILVIIHCPGSQLTNWKPTFHSLDILQKQCNHESYVYSSWGIGTCFCPKHRKCPSSGICCGALKGVITDVFLISHADFFMSSHFDEWFLALSTS